MKMTEQRGSLIDFKSSVASCVEVFIVGEICCRVTGRNSHLKAVLGCNFFFLRAEAWHCLDRIWKIKKIIKKWWYQTSTTSNKRHDGSFSNSSYFEKICQLFQPSEGRTLPTTSCSYSLLFFQFDCEIQSQTMLNSCCCKINARWMHVGRRLRKPPLNCTAC